MVAVKVVLVPEGHVMTVAFAIGLSIQELKCHLASELRVPADVLQISLDGMDGNLFSTKKRWEMLFLFWCLKVWRVLTAMNKLRWQSIPLLPTHCYLRSVLIPGHTIDQWFPKLFLLCSSNFFLLGNVSLWSLRPPGVLLSSVNTLHFSDLKVRLDQWQLHQCFHTISLIHTPW